MIDIRELRIGNYVLPNNTIGAQSAVGVVFSINDYLVSVKGNSNQYDYHLLEGVSLTEKILVDAGFNYVSDCTCFPKEIGDKFAIGLKLEQNTGDLFYITNKAYNGILTIPAVYKVLYVHQLQNLYFFLTGKELEVKL